MKGRILTRLPERANHRRHARGAGVLAGRGGILAGTLVRVLSQRLGPHRRRRSGRRHEPRHHRRRGGRTRVSGAGQRVAGTDRRASEVAVDSSSGSAEARSRDSSCRRPAPLSMVATSLRRLRPSSPPVGRTPADLGPDDHGDRAVLGRRSDRHGRSGRGVVITIDHFGNLITNIDAGLIQRFAHPVVRTGGHSFAAAPDLRRRPARRLPGSGQFVRRRRDRPGRAERRRRLGTGAGRPGDGLRPLTASPVAARTCP